MMITRQKKKEHLNQIQTLLKKVHLRIKLRRTKQEGFLQGFSYDNF
jgi:hypothetical protein